MSEIKVNSIKGVGASAAAITVNNTDGTCTANITNNLSNRNVIINGAMQVNQRGNQTGISSGGSNFALDRWTLALSNAGTWSISQSTDTPDGFGNSLKLDCTTADASLGSGDYIFLRQKLEGQDCQAFAKGTSAAKQFAVSFYVKTNKSGVYTVELMDNDNNRVATKTFTVSDGNWNRYTLIFPADTTGAFDNDNAQSLTFDIWLGAGSGYTSGTFNTSSWAAKVNANRASSSNVNLADSTSNEFYLTGVQLEVGSVATDFEHRSFGQELALCQRYFERIVITGNDIFFYGVNQFGSQGRIPLFFRVTKRAIPTVSIDDANFAYYAVAGSGSNGSGSFAVNSYSKDTMGISSVGTGSSTAYWTNKSNDGYVDASAEL